MRKVRSSMRALKRHSKSTQLHEIPCSDSKIGVFTLVTRGWAASEFLTRTSKFNMTPNGECQIMGPDQSQIFDACVTNVKTLKWFSHWVTLTATLSV